ncbi:MAG: hypothetical protein CV087_09575 [Candidatus Brocadia sp. WS118]|nr:MAG: hypothetical protein CV087_09575 [Candidatus Brocadia sp. WS118]
MNTKIILGMAVAIWITGTLGVSAFADNGILEYIQEVETQIKESNSKFLSDFMNNYIENIKEQIGAK